MRLRELIATPLIFEWDRGNRDKNWVKHGIANDEAEEPFDDVEALLVHDIRHSHHEARYILIGKTDERRILFLVFTIRAHKIRVISARPANRKEVDYYEKAAQLT